MSNKIEAVLFDWAGTTVDYGCFAPLEVFLEVFKRKGIDLTLEEARGPMGMLKIDHIRALTQIPRIKEQWVKVYGREPNEKDVKEMYEDFEPSLLKILPNYTTPIPGVVEAVKEIRDMGLKIGSTTGYTDKMMEIVKKGAKEKGYEPDTLFTPDGLPGGRPYPWMCYENAKKLGVYPMNHIIKVGDTLSDVKEGVNAGCWSVGVIMGSNELGLHEEEVLAMPYDELSTRCKEVRERFLNAGAHFVIKTMSELPDLIKKINNLLQEGKTQYSIG